MTHQIIQDLKSRYTCKKYDNTKKVTQDELEILKEALQLSASSINSQPWKFIILESDEAKQRMHDTFANNYQFNQPHIKECSHVILFAHKVRYTQDDLNSMIDESIADKRLLAEQREMMEQAYMGFVNLNEDEQGNHRAWTKLQTYIALGNALHTLARLKIDSTAMEGVDAALISDEFKAELNGYECEVALCIGYHSETEDYNASLPKSRRALKDVVTTL